QAVPGRRGGLVLLLDGLLALGGDAPGLALVLDDLEEVAGGGHVVPAHDLDGSGRAGLLDLAALVVDEGADLARHGPGDEGVALAEGAALDDDGGDGAAATLQLGLDDHAGGGGLRVGLVALE